MSLALVAFGVVGLLTLGGWRRPPTLDASAADLAWPWMLAEIETRSDGEPVASVLAEAALDAMLRGPRGTRSAVHAAARALGPSVSSDVLLGEVRELLASARSDRLCDLVDAVGLTGAPPRALLTGLRHRETADAAHHARWRRTLRAGRAGRWLLLAPLAPIAVGVIDGPAARLSAAAAVGLWWLAGAWLDAAGPRRSARTTADAAGRPAASATG